MYSFLLEDKDEIIRNLLEVNRQQALLIDQLRAEIAEFKAEIARLKGNPAKPKLQPSKVFDMDSSDQKMSHSKKTTKKAPSKSIKK